MAYLIGIMVGAVPAFIVGWYFGARSAYKKVMFQIASAGSMTKIHLEGIRQRDVQ